jgi:hypothetical protein
MNLLCKWFGHKISGDKYADSPFYTRYLRANGYVKDALNVRHYHIYAHCDRCDELFKIGNIHASDEGMLYDNSK